MPRIKKGKLATRVALASELSFDSGLPSEMELQNAALDPLSKERRDEDGGPVLAGGLQRNAVTLAQAVNVIAANRNLIGQHSLGSGALAGINDLVSSKTFRHDGILSNVLDLGVSYLDTAVVEALGSVPYVRMAAAAIKLLVEVAKLFDDANFREGRPPLFQMTPRADTDRTISALEMLDTEDDWTRLYLPRTEAWSAFSGGATQALPDTDQTNPCQRWPIEEIAENGMAFSRKPLRGGGPPNFGVAPGSLDYVDDGAQSRIVESDITLPSQKNPTYANALDAGENLDAVSKLTFGRGEWMPSLSALGRAVWAMLGTNATTTLWAVDASKVESAWAEWHESMVWWRCFNEWTYGKGLSTTLPTTMGKEVTRSHIAVALSRLGAAQHDRLALAGTSGSERARRMRVLLVGRAADRGRSVGSESAKHAQRLAARQKSACGTVLGALVSADAPAFRGQSNKALRDHLLRERAQMLDAGKFDAVDLADVPDPNLRYRITERARSGGVRTDAAAIERADKKRKLEAWVIRTQVPDPLEFSGGVASDPEDESGGGYGLAIAGLLATAGLTAGGVALARRRRNNPTPRKGP